MKRKDGSFDVTAELPALRRYALVLTRDPAEAEELLQDALLRGHERRATWRPGLPLRPWLMSILHNVHVSRRRRDWAALRRDDEAGRQPSAEGGARQDDLVLLGEVGRALMALPEDQREALLLVAVEGLSYEEAAAILDIPAGTLTSRLSRGRAALRDRFADGTSAMRPRQPPLRLVPPRLMEGS
jgi:RNA polymerase sigma-70 factor (ECF subfamily)